MTGTFIIRSAPVESETVEQSTFFEKNKGHDLSLWKYIVDVIHQLVSGYRFEKI